MFPLNPMKRERIDVKRIEKREKDQDEDNDEELMISQDG